MEVFPFRTLPRRGIVLPLDRLETILNTGKEVTDFLEVADSRLFPVDEIFPQILLPGTELGASGDNLGLPAVVSEILMELTTLILFSFVLLGAGGVLAGDDFI
jgi:hypothetical protein